MPRILHLHDSPADFQTSRFVAALAGDPLLKPGTQVQTIGPGGTYFASIPGILALRRTSERFDLVHAWGEVSLRVAAFGGATPIVYTPSSNPHRSEVRWLRSIMDHRNVHVICSSDTQRRTLVERGVPIDRCTLVRPGVSMAGARRRRNDDLRSALGIGPNDRVTLAPGESTREAAHNDAAFALAMLCALEKTNKLLVWGRGPRSDALRRFAATLRQPSFVDAEHTLGRRVEFEELLSVADEVLITATGPVPTLPVCICMAAGLPIVALVTPTIAELLEDRHTALMVGRRSPRLLCERILDLRADSRTQWSISDMAHTEAYEFFSLSRFLQEHRTIYEQFAEGRPVELPQRTAGAGSRFHGRA